MRIVGICRIKNEIDIVEAFVRHNLYHVDKLLFSDDGSFDGTFELLQRLASDGLPIDVISQPTIGYYQARYTTDLMNRAAYDEQADWIVPIGADEFIETKDGAPLGTILASVPLQPFHVAWHNFAWSAETEDDPEPNPVVRLRYRQPDDFSVSRKIVLPGQLVRDARVVIKSGNHSARVDGAACPFNNRDYFVLCHYPIRSVGQYITKVATVHLQTTVSAHLFSGVARPYRHPYHVLCTTKDGARALMEKDYHATLTLDYSKPGGMQSTGAEIRPMAYMGAPIEGPRQDADALRNVLRYAEQLAMAYSKSQAGALQKWKRKTVHALVERLGFYSPLRQSRVPAWRRIRDVLAPLRSFDPSRLRRKRELG